MEFFFFHLLWRRSGGTALNVFWGLRKVCSEDFVGLGGKRIPPSGFFGYGRHLLRHVSKRGFKGRLEEGIWAYVKRYFFFLYL